MASKSKFVLYAALAGNVAIAVTKFVAAGLAGSSSMLTEGIHSLVDSGNQVLMLYGRHRSQLPPDDLHPLGHGRELYFWSFVVALLIFTAGAGVSIYEGLIHIQHPEMLSDPWINYGVIALAIIFESTSLTFAIREFHRRKEPGETWWKALRTSKDPAIFVVMFEDSAAVCGLLVAATFITLTVVTGNPLWDGVGSILIGVILGAVAIVLARECKALLIGERARPELQRMLQDIATDQQGVCAVNEVLTIHLAPDQIIAMLSLDFVDDLALTGVENTAATIELTAKSRCPEIKRLFIRPQSRQQASTEQDILHSRGAPQRS